MIEDLYSISIIPKNIYAYFHMIRILGNLSVHYDPVNINAVNLQDIKIISIVMANIVNWYISSDV